MPQTTYQSFQSKTPGTMRIASYNLYWLNGTCEIDHPKSTTKLMRKIGADILLLQETTPKLEHCIKQYLRRDYPYMTFYNHPKDGGLAVLSRYPFSKPRLIKPQHGWFPAWLLTAHTKRGDIQILNLHLTPSVDKQDNVGMLFKHLFNSTGIRKKEMRELYQHLDQSQPTIIAGDFNESDFGGAVKFLRWRGYQDVILMDKRRQDTWVHKYGPITLAGRYDRIFVSEEFTPQCVQLLHESSSDHYPIVVDLTNS